MNIMHQTYRPSARNAKRKRGGVFLFQEAAIRTKKPLRADMGAFYRYIRIYHSEIPSAVWYVEIIV
jgi:hypothetical protein